MYKKKDYRNIKYNRFTVLYDDEIKSKETGSRYCWCQCDCGSEPKSMKISNVINGHSKSCGCITKERFNIPENGYIGEKFGRLTILSKDEDKSKDRRIYYFCQCECKSEIISVRIDSLKSGKTTSCGCYKKEMQYLAVKKYNTYDLTGSYGIGYTTNGYEFYFDLKNYDLIKSHCWYRSIYKYIVTYASKKTIFMHRLIMKTPNDMETDHKSGCRYDNREENLRICTHAENQWNKESNGYARSKTIGKWQAYIRANNKRYYLGTFNNENDAKQSRIDAEKEYYGEFSRKN